MDMHIANFENASIADLVAGYMIRTHAFMRHPDEAHYDQLDASFRRLREEQQRRAPHLKSAVDALGAAACDLVNARWPADSHALVVAHDRAMSALLDALTPVTA